MLPFRSVSCLHASRAARSLRALVALAFLIPLGTECARAVEYEITSFQDLGTLGSTGGTNPFGINEAGDVVGFGFDAEGYMKAFRWSNGQIQAVPGMWNAFDINEDGDIVGDMQIDEYTPSEPLNPFRPTRAALYRNGALINLGSLDDDDPYASGFIYAINNHGAMVGTANAGKTPDGDFGDNQPPRAVFSNGSGLTILDGFGESGLAYDINDAGQIVGLRWNEENTAYKAYLRQPQGLAIDITPAGATIGQALAINENGDIMGRADGKLFMRWADGRTEYLPNTLWYDTVYTSGMNDQAWVVGEYDAQNRTVGGAFFHDGTTMIDLSTLAAGYLAGEGQTGIYRLIEATAINNNGQIVGYGKYRAPNGEAFWERGFIMTIVRKPPAILAHDVNILGEPHGFLPGAQISVISEVGEPVANLTANEEGRAVLPNTLDLDALYKVEIMYDTYAADGLPGILSRSYQNVRLSEVADGNLKLALPVTLRAVLDDELKKLEATGTFVTPYDTGGARALMAGWNNLSPRSYGLHVNRDHAMARLKEAAHGLARVYAAVEELSLDAAKVICETIMGLTSLRKVNAEMIEQLESHVASELATSVLDSEVARFAISCMLISAQNMAKAAQKTFIASLKTVAPGTASDLADEALKVAMKGLVAGLESGAWDKKKGIAAARSELLKDITTKVASEVGGRVFASAHVLATQEDFETAVTRAELLSGDGQVIDGRNAVSAKAIDVENKVTEALNLSTALDDTSKGFDWVADLSAAVGRVPPAKIATVMSAVIKGLNVVMSAAAAGRDLDTLIAITKTDTPEVASLAYFPFPAGGGGGADTFAAIMTMEDKRPIVQESSSETSAYQEALLGTRNAVSTGAPISQIIVAGDALLAQDAPMEALLDARSERLAALATSANPPDSSLVYAGQALATARNNLSIATSALYPLLAGLAVPSIADPDATPASILAAFDTVATALAEVNAALSQAASVSGAMSAPAKLVVTGHGLSSGAVGARPGLVTLNARILNAGDVASEPITVTLEPELSAGSVVPLRLTSTASASVPALAAGESVLVEWQGIITDTSVTGNGSSAAYLITATIAGQDPIQVEGAIGINGSGMRFEDWIGSALADGAPSGFTEDADGDGKGNGLERFFGGAPNAADEKGLEIHRNGELLKLRHPRASDPGPDVSAFYEWSPNLVDWIPSGTTFGGNTVELTPVVVAGEGTAEKAVEVVPQATKNAARLFFRLRVEQDSPIPPPPEPLAAPAITNGPASPQSIHPGDPLTLAVECTGTGPLIFQWLKDGVELIGQNHTTLFIPSFTSADSGAYRVRITGAAGNLISPEYVVEVSDGGGSF